MVTKPTLKSHQWPLMAPRDPNLTSPLCNSFHILCHCFLLVCTFSSFFSGDQSFGSTFGYSSVSAPYDTSYCCGESVGLNCWLHPQGSASPLCLEWSDYADMLETILYIWSSDKRLGFSSLLWTIYFKTDGILPATDKFPSYFIYLFIPLKICIMIWFLLYCAVFVLSFFLVCFCFFAVFCLHLWMAWLGLSRLTDFQKMFHIFCLFLQKPTKHDHSSKK